MKTSIYLLLIIILTSCTQTKQFVDRLECPYIRLTKQHAVYVSKVEIIKAACFEDRKEVFIKFFTYNDNYQYSFVTFDDVCAGDTLIVTPEILQNIKIKRIK